MGRAARRLFLTPSAVSHAIRSFEEALGYPLFDRTTRSLALTREGALLLPHVQQAVDALVGLRTVVGGGRPLREGRLRIGASPTACQFLIPSVIREFKESCPDITLRITQGSAAEIAHDVMEGKIDLGLCPKSPEHRSLSCTTIASDTLAFIVNPMHPWARRGNVDTEKLHLERFALAESRSFTKGLIDDYFRKRGTVITPFIEIGNEEVIKELVRLDIGVGIFPPWIAAEEIEQGLLLALPLGRHPPTRDWVVCHRTGHQLSFGETLFLGISRLIASVVIGQASKSRE